MQPISITVKNYRCFDDENPLRIDITPGLTALVGPNNSGKSSVLKFFYELRPLFSQICSQSFINKLVINSAMGISYLGVDDPYEIFHNKNKRPLSIEINFPKASRTQITSVELVIQPTQSSAIRGKYHVQNGQRLVERKGISGESNNQLGFATTTGHVLIDFSALEEVCNAFTESIYIGAFRNAINEGAASFYDMPIGQSFITSWNNWKTGSGRQVNEAAQKVADDLARIFGYNRLEINSVNNNQNIQVIIDGKPFKLREIGSGLAQFIIVFAYVAFRKPKFLLLDEPELNLHPSLQMDFLTSLASYTSLGVIFATHSIGLARSTADKVYSLQKTGDSSRIRSFEHISNYAEFIGEMSFSSFKEMGHDSVLLVEGVTEVKAVQQFLRELRKDHTVVIIPLGGSQFIRGGVQAELAELGRLSKNVAVMIDSERTNADGPMHLDRTKFLQECQELGFKTHSTRLRAFENYLSAPAIQQVKGNGYRALGPYEKLSDLPKTWAKTENWRIARAMTRKEILATDIGEFLSSLD